MNKIEATPVTEQPIEQTDTSVMNTANTASSTLSETIGNLGDTIQPQTVTPDAISVYYKDENGNVLGKQYLTVPQIAAVRNFAKNNRDVSDQSGFKLKVVQDSSDKPSEKYYDSSFLSSTYYRIGDKDKTPLSFDKTAYTLSESQYEACLESIKDLDRQRGIIDYELITSTQKQKTSSKPFLVETGDWIQHNLFDTIANITSINLLGTIIKKVGNVLTGFLKTLGYAFSGDFSSAGTEGFSWLKNTAIIGGSAIGVYQLGKKLEWWGTKKESTIPSTLTSELTNEIFLNTLNSNVSTTNNLNTATLIKNTPNADSIKATDTNDQNLHIILGQNGATRSNNTNDAILSTQQDKINL